MRNGKEKVFFLGMPKTGLSTIKGALEVQGYAVSGSPRRIYGRSEGEIRNAFRTKAVRGLLAEHDAFCDLPWGLEYKWLYEQFPESVFVLTVRADEEWVDSYIAQFAGQSNLFHWMAFGEMSRCGDRQKLIYEYRKFNKDVLDHFSSCKRFFVLDTPEDLRWENLGVIFDRDLGSGRLPKRNPKENRASFGWWMRRKPRAFAGRIVRSIRGSR